MNKRLLALLVSIALVLPALALGEGSTLPYGFQFGMNTDAVEAAIAADATLSKMEPDIEDDDESAVEYLFFDVAIPGTELSADSVSLQIDENNSDLTDKMTSLSFVLNPESDQSIGIYRTLLTAMSATLGAPELDPFSDESSVASYVEWGTLDAYWTLPDARISLSLNRMFGDSITLQYSSRLNYNKADLAQ